MKYNGLPEKQGLYDPSYEKDACGIGFVVNIKGTKSHNIVRQAIRILINLTHRGGVGAEANTGDGAGILVQLPHLFFKRECAALKYDLPGPGEYGVGMVFLPTEEKRRIHCENVFNQIVEKEGLEVICWRTVPVDPSSLGRSAVKSMPFMRQIFIRKNPSVNEDIQFERKLYVIRKKVEKALRYSGEENYDFFYVASLSCRTIVYKGMLLAEQVDRFYKDLADPSFETALALVHSRYSTNTFPSWERAHPNRYIIHNGEINTLRGNINWMSARQAGFKSELFEGDIADILPVINPDGSDSAMFDNCFEFLSLSGRSMAHSAMMMIPEPWSNHESMTDEKKAFYEYHATLLEPWDGPASIAFTDGVRVGAVLDRNGLRPSRYYVTKDDLVIMSSEVGVLEYIHPERIKAKDRLRPGRMLLIDTKARRIITDEEIKHQMASQLPYGKWLEENLITLDDLKIPVKICEGSPETLVSRQKAFGYTYEDLKTILSPMAKDGIDPVGAMGNDIPLAVLSDKSQLLFNYFKQLFAQVTNPPIDALREEIVTGKEIYLGSEGDLLEPGPESCRQLKLKTPIINNQELEKIRKINRESFKSVTIPILFSPDKNRLEEAMGSIFKKADEAYDKGVNIIILSDRGINRENAAIPSLLAVSGLHHHLIRNGRRTKVAIVLESGEPREVHHFSLLLGYGVSAVNPYLAFESIERLIEEGAIENIEYEKACINYIKASTKGVIKVLSKMGISTIQSYQGAQIFEAVGLGSELTDKYFTNTPSRINGLNVLELAEETLVRHRSAYCESGDSYRKNTLEPGGVFQWRKDGEYHLFNPETIYKLQVAARGNDYEAFKEYSQSIDKQTQRLSTLRGLMDLDYTRKSIPLEEVESVESICRRFKTGAMSYGSISLEAHEALAVAMNRIGGKSNTGEGGEDPARFLPQSNGDSKCSAIKQVASGRFGVTSHYLVNAMEIQIKMAQGAKPGEGGQLPGRKVYPWIAKTRHSTPGVGLISPPPHHDIYSIEDLAELIHDLKNANDQARICVKLVSEVGVGTIAAGVAKGRADVVLISGYDGGTGASPRTSVKHAGLPWELGLAETHQTLVLNNLRSRITVETDGKLLTGRDVVIAALLGAEEFGFATAPLVALGCVMMRVCNLDTCPVGVATQNPGLRHKFCGEPEYVVNLMHFIALEVREYMARLGYRNFDEMVGQMHRIKMKTGIKHWKTANIDLSKIFKLPDADKETPLYCQIEQNHKLEESFDKRILLHLCQPAIDEKKKIRATLPIYNTNRVVGTILGSEISRRYGAEGLPEDTIKLTFQGSAGQSFGAFVPKGITLKLEGDANDYIGKGLSGGKIIVYPPAESTFVPEENIIVGNVAFYGATSGEAYIQGAAGERFCVRNSGVEAVVEALGDHGCEYMTGGKVVVLGSTGRNFAAGMSGGIAYVLDMNEDFKTRCNTEMVDLEKLKDLDEIEYLKSMIYKHFDYTGSKHAKGILDLWDEMLPKFVKVMPRDYKRMINTIKRMNESGLSGEEALMAAFEANNKDISRISGN